MTVRRTPDTPGAKVAGVVYAMAFGAGMGVYVSRSGAPTWQAVFVGLVIYFLSRILERSA